MVEEQLVTLAHAGIQCIPGKAVAEFCISVFTRGMAAPQLCPPAADINDSGLPSVLIIADTDFDTNVPDRCLGTPSKHRPAATTQPVFEAKFHRRISTCDNQLPPRKRSNFRLFE